MSRIMLSAAVLLGLAAPFVIDGAAEAQCRLCGTPTTSAGNESADARASLEVETSLAFDRIVLLSDTGGTATLRPDGSRSVTGGLTELSGRAMVGNAIVRGEPGRIVRVDLPKRIDLYSLSGDSVSIEEVISDLPDIARLDSTGKLVFHFGGRLKVSGSADGDYRGDLPIFVDYL